MASKKREKMVTRAMGFTPSALSAAEDWLHDNCPDICSEDFNAVAESLAVTLYTYAAQRQGKAP